MRVLSAAAGLGMLAAPMAVVAAPAHAAEPIGEIAGPFLRAAKVDGSTENLGGESTLGNLVAEAQRWATSTDQTGAAQIAFTDPGGLRADLVGSTPGSYPATLTYEQVAAVLPLARTLVTMDLTGAQVRAVLEEQWQPAGAPHPFLRLGTSKGFRYTYDPSATAGRHVTGMWLHGTPIAMSETYSVTVNAFLASGGDNFTELADGTGRRDTGQTDLQGMVDYLAQFADGAALPVGHRQHAVGVRFPELAPTWYQPRDNVSFDLSSLAFTAPGDLHDANVEVALGDRILGTFPVDNTAGDEAYDEYGTASVSVTLPTHSVGRRVLTVTGDTTRTAVKVPVRVTRAPALVKLKTSPEIVVADETRPQVSILVTTGLIRGTGKVLVRTRTRTYTARLEDGTALVTLAPFSHAGEKRIRVVYLGDYRTLKTNNVTALNVVSAT